MREIDPANAWFTVTRNAENAPSHRPADRLGPTAKGLESSQSPDLVLEKNGAPKKKRLSIIIPGLVLVLVAAFLLEP